MNNFKKDFNSIVESINSELDVYRKVFTKSEQINITTFYETLLERLYIKKENLEENVLKAKFGYDNPHRESNLNDVTNLINEIEEKMNSGSFLSLEYEIKECETINNWLDYIHKDTANGLRHHIKETRKSKIIILN
jgi:hypothetical protein